VQVKRIELSSLQDGDNKELAGDLDEIAETPVSKSQGGHPGSKCILGDLDTVVEDTPNTSSKSYQNVTKSPIFVHSVSTSGKRASQSNSKQDITKADTPLDGFKLHSRRRSSLLRSSLGTPLVDVTPKNASTSRKHGRDSLAKAVSLRNIHGEGHANVLRQFETPKRKTPMSVRDIAEASPGVFIPSVRELEITGTELAEDMAGNLVAGIFSVSEPNPDLLLQASKTLEGSDDPNNMSNSKDSIMNVSQQHDNNPIYLIDKDKSPMSFMLRFSDCCLYMRISESKKYIALLMGSPIDKEPREIVIICLDAVSEDEIENEKPCFALEVVRTIPVQKSRYFPRSIPYNVNFFALSESKKGDPILIVSSALELADVALTQTGQLPLLNIVPCGAKAKMSNVLSIELDQAITFVDNLHEERYSLAVSGSYADDGARIMKFDPMWQSFAWGKQYKAALDACSRLPTTHISKLISLGEQLEAVLASDCSSSDTVFSFTGCKPGQVQHIDNAEIFMDGRSWKWFLRHQELIEDLDFAGGASTEADKAKIPTEPRTGAVIFASETYVAYGDLNGLVQIWDIPRRQSAKISVNKGLDTDDKRISGIVETSIGIDTPALFITSASGVCMFVACDELFPV
jgi:hypothetical protein